MKVYTENEIKDAVYKAFSEEAVVVKDPAGRMAFLSLSDEQAEMSGKIAVDRVVKFLKK